MNASPAYGLWGLAAVNAAVFIIFAFSFAKPQSSRDWRSFGAFSAFIVALFAEMYGFPLTIFFLSGWLQRRYPSLDILSHDAGHLWATMLGLRGNPHFGVLHMLSSAFIIAGFLLLSAAWRVLYEAQRRHRLATTGPYSYVRQDGTRPARRPRGVGRTVQRGRDQAADHDHRKRVLRFGAATLATP